MASTGTKNFWKISKRARPLGSHPRSSGAAWRIPALPQQGCAPPFAGADPAWSTARIRGAECPACHAGRRIGPARKNAGSDPPSNETLAAISRLKARDEAILQMLADAPDAEAVYALSTTSSSVMPPDTSATRS